MSSFIENGKSIFRLSIVLLYLCFVFNSGFAIKQQETPAAEHGIGGGSLSGEIILANLTSETEEGVILSPASLETVEIEPESFSKTPILLFDTHTVQRGENISGLAVDFGLNQGTLISVNKITNSRLLQAGKVIKIPNQDGIFHTVRNGDTLLSIAEKYKADTEAIQTANELFSEKIRAGTDLFIPGAKLDWNSLQEINGDLFIWPVSGAITSPYGYRRSPFTGNRQFHSGIDIKGSRGTPIRAAMAGRVSQVGYDNVFGNYVIINHHSGYRTLYGHMSVIRTKSGAYVGAGERIGDVGSTGQSTGPHLHFTVYKNGVTVNPRSLVR